MEAASSHLRSRYRYPAAIRSLRESGGKVSNKLLREFPALADENLAAETVEAIEEAFGSR